MGFETFKPVRRRRQPNRLPYISLSDSLYKGRSIGQILSVNRSALALIDIRPKRGDDIFFLIEVDRESDAIRLTATGETDSARRMNPVSGQIFLPLSFRDWTGWGNSRWGVRAENNTLIGNLSIAVDPAAIESEPEP